MKHNIAVVTGTRAEYGLLSLLMHEIKNDHELTLQTIVTGMHLSPEFGLTYQLIEKDGFNIDAKVEMLLSSDTETGISKSVGLGVIGFSDAFSQLKPDLLVLLGDRFETLAAAETALIHKIPIAHIHGGELSEGAIDDAIRHAITKMSHLHFVAADIYKERVIQMGENPNSVFNFGAPGLERIKRYPLLSLTELEKKLNLKLGQFNFLITYHPETLHLKNNLETFENLLSALEHFPSANLIFTKANADEAGRVINAKIDEYVASEPNRAFAFITLGDLNYLSLLQYVDVVIGNSSSGIIEVPLFKKPTINIGYRQNKRLRAKSIIDSSRNMNDIIAAIEKALSTEFMKTVAETHSLYTLDHTALKIKNKIKEVNFKKIIHKQFYDIEKEFVEV